MRTGLNAWAGAFASPLTLDAQRRLGPRFEPLGGDLLAALLARAVRAALSRPHRVLDLGLLALQQLLGGLLHLALEQDVRGIGRMLIDTAQLTRNFPFIAGERGVVLRLTERRQLFRATR